MKITRLVQVVRQWVLSAKNDRRRLRTLRCLSVFICGSLLWYSRQTSDARQSETMPQERCKTPFNIYSQHEPRLTIGTVVSPAQIREGTVDNANYLRSISSIVQLIPQDRLIIMTERLDVVCNYTRQHFPHLRCVDIDSCSSNRFKRPNMSCIFETLHRESETEDVAFINSDVMIFPDFLDSLTVARRFEKYAMIGRRVNFYIGPRTPQLLDVRCDALKGGLVDGDYAIDYVVYRKRDFPLFDTPYIVGNWRWDNVLLANFYKRLNVHVVDASRTAVVVHQLVSSTQSGLEDRQHREAGEYNDELAAKYDPDFNAGSISYASFRLERGKGATITHETSKTGSDLIRCALKAGDYMQIHGEISKIGRSLVVQELNKKDTKLSASCLWNVKMYLKSRKAYWRLALKSY